MKIQLPLGLGEDLEIALRAQIPELSDYRILKKSVDARRGRHKPVFIYVIEYLAGSEGKLAVENFDLPLTTKKFKQPVIVIGAGPAGLFCALRLAERGVPVVCVEQGAAAEKRVMQINRFWRYGELNEQSNVCFGEGGAGLYSDGKLITRIKSPFIPYVLRRLVDFGAPAEIEYLSNPHVGSDRIRRLIPKMRARLTELGVQIMFESKVSGFAFNPGGLHTMKLASGETLESENIVLATGHSSEELLVHLRDTSPVFIEPKSFAIGLRVEHPQKFINECQYRESANHPSLGAANYKLNYYDEDLKESIYTFCMCPGGYVLSSSTHQGTVVSNGMSNFARNSPFANSAVVVAVDQETFARKNKNPLAGMDYRRTLEQRFYSSVRSKKLPAQRLTDFLARRGGAPRDFESDKVSSSLSGIQAANLSDLFPKEIATSLRRGLEKFDAQMKGFRHEEALLLGVESRTSAPWRITRDSESLQSITQPGFYPCGEGAGYAGGITSAACDGIRVAEKIAFT